MGGDGCASAREKVGVLARVFGQMKLSTKFCVTTREMLCTQAFSEGDALLAFCYLRFSKRWQEPKLREHRRGHYKSIFHGCFSTSLPPPPPAHQISKSYPRPALELPGDPHSNLDANPIACQAWFQTSASLHGVLHSAACLFATGQVQRVSVWQLRKNTRAESKI